MLSVCPSLFKTPPSVYLRGNTCPGLARSSGKVSGDISVSIVLALSLAEIPVVAP